MIPSDAPPPKGRLVTLTHYVDANLYHDCVTGRSVTGILHFINATPIDWFSKRQSTVETATYGSEFVAARTCVEQVIDLRNTLRHLKVQIFFFLNRQGLNVLQYPRNEYPISVAIERINCQLRDDSSRWYHFYCAFPLSYMSHTTYRYSNEKRVR